MAERMIIAFLFVDISSIFARSQNIDKSDEDCLKLFDEQNETWSTPPWVGKKQRLENGIRYASLVESSETS